jgi:dTMP kinase
VAAVIAGTPARAVIADVAARAEAPAGYRAARPTPAAAADAFYAFCAERAEREPGVVAYFLAGMTDARAWEHRAALADVVPDEIAYSIRGLDDEPAWALRERLAEATPFQVVKSVAGRWVDARRAHALRRRFADAQPRAVLSSLRGDVSEPAWALRRRLAGAYPLEVVGSLARDDGAEAWALRDALAARPGAVDDPLTAAVLARSLRAVAGERAWALRRRVFDAAPIPALASLAELADDDAWQWRERFAERAPKTVMGSLAGSEDPRAWALRGAHAERVKEAIDSMIGLDSDAAWALRARCEDIWPSTVLKSAIPLARTARAEALAARVLEHHGDNLSALKHGARFYAAVTDAAALEVVV